MTLAFDAVLLAGGRASRLGGDDKTAFTHAGATLLDQAIDAARGARTLVVVGPRDGVVVPAGAVVAREDPPWSGPVAALAAGLGVVEHPAPWTLVLACDLPRAPEAVRALLDARLGARPGHDPDLSADGLVAVDDDGRRQPLLALYRTAAVHTRLTSLRADGPLEGLSLRRLLAGLGVVEASVASELCADVDTPEDAARLGVERRPTRATG
ncbi:molybdenum cofactor guanylyltransferase [Frigoribacterium faeni]|uniref:Molybdopterin-guanine dinucleotide biosynthesis protein A n=1 Tax=Frigoribacterium faeni TaxID=145483 RepID=A0A7W3JIK9_9MICO|nr:molybdenum cofactor guanylyltransferase [Frigoribacterium faeni]MBA8813518.1 molybdopterin-guanine dinucleotide biosynthesis protein A [Frigoribacterium faeni]BFF14776.1 hypothetical protein GCM10025699_60790 [Microbacterium flavescens]GEK82764.1 hypothetical protein FFA01_10730 [Frigoribacterium faeni]